MNPGVLGGWLVVSHGAADVTYWGLSLLICRMGEWQLPLSRMGGVNEGSPVPVLVRELALVSECPMDVGISVL